MSKTNLFISFSFDSSIEIKEHIVSELKRRDIIADYSEKVDRSMYSDQTIWSSLRDRIVGSSVTLVIYSRDFLRGSGGKALSIDDASEYSSQISDPQFKQGWIYKEIRASLADEQNNPTNGIIVVIPDDYVNDIFSWGTCKTTGSRVRSINSNQLPPIIYENIFNIRNSFNSHECGCCYDRNYGSYISIIKLSDFLSDPESYIEIARNKRKESNKYEIRRNI